VEGVERTERLVVLEEGGEDGVETVVLSEEERW
jgi:hypothetical protein